MASDDMIDEALLSVLAASGHKPDYTQAQHDAMRAAVGKIMMDAYTDVTDSKYEAARAEHLRRARNKGETK